MSIEPTPPLSEECAREVAREMAAAPEDTPERRGTFRVVRRIERLIRSGECADLSKGYV